MKAIRVLLVLALAIAVLGMAQGASAGAFTYTSGFQVQNLEATQANVTITFYNQDGTVNGTPITDTIDANGDKTYFPLTSVSDGFNGSVVISADKQVAAIGNVLANDFSAGASYSAANTGSKTLQLPLLMKDNNGYNTWFNVQNTGAAAASVSVAYTDGTTASATVQPGAAYTFDQATETHSQAVFGATVTADQNIAATVIEESSSIMFAYSGFPGSGSTDPVMPLINANNNNYVTGVQILNAGSANSDLTVTYTGTDGSSCTETQTVEAGKTGTFALSAFASGGSNTTCTAGQTLVGSAQVTSNSASVPLYVIVNQLGTVDGEAYNGFDLSAATAKVIMPLIMDRNSGWFTGFNVQNVGSSSTTVTCTFKDSTHTVSDTLAPGEPLNNLQYNQIADGYVGSGTCTAGSGGMIIGVVNELQVGGTADQLLVYEGVNVTP
jgi:hypothetical protein